LAGRVVGRQPLLQVGLAGNPNAGKTSLFNLLTGLRQKVGNYPGVTVERKIGRARCGDREVEIVDLPGTYSLIPVSIDEQVAVDVLLGRRADTPAPDVVVAVADAQAIARSLYLVTQLAELGRPLVVALTMPDLAERDGRPVDAAALAQELGVAVVAIDARTGRGLDALRQAVRDAAPATAFPWKAAAEDGPEDLLDADIAQRYRWIDGVVARCVTVGQARRSLVDRLDGVLLHRVWGLVVFALIMATLFVAIFVVAQPIMDGCDALVRYLGGLATNWLPAGDLRQLLQDGVVGGVGSVIVFVPQIALLFLFLGILEDSGYLARAAFLMDRLLARVGLHGRSFVPLLSSFACAIPGIMSARTIANPRERLATVLVAPFMSCSARLPVYAVVIAACFAAWSPVAKAGLLLGCYALGIGVAVACSWLAMRLRGRGTTAPFLLELPAWRAPQVKAVARVVWQNTSAFLTRAGTVIFALSVLIWALTTYPRPSEAEVASATAAFERQELAAPGSAEDRDDRREHYLEGAAIDHTLAGRAGRLIEPVIRPLGFDGDIGIGLVAAFAAREVFVSTLGIVYRVGDDEGGVAQAMQGARRDDGRPVWTTATACSLLVWFVLAMQCVSTTAVVRRETGGWTWPLLQIAGMNALAWVASFVTYQLLVRLT
jgi:ferrous iron transport protein B